MADRQLQDQLTDFIASHYDSPVTVSDLKPMEDSHAGLTYGFDLVRDGALVESFVMRLAPAGVRLKGNTDVYRQAPLMRALHRAGQPVPAVRWAGEEPRWFGVPYLIMEKLPGRTLIIWEPAGEFSLDPEVIGELWIAAATALAGLHQFDWQRHLADWEKPQPILKEIRKWDRILEQTTDPEWKAAGEAVRALLLQHPPPPSPVGLFHGDYQPGNVLYREGTLVAIVDWELAGIGAQLIDLGWLMMMGDPLSWAPNWQPGHPPSQERLQQAYQTVLGETTSALPWYQALAGYRFGVISCLNVKLHRRGQRHDPMWEQFAPSIPFLFNRARSLLLAYR